MHHVFLVLLVACTGVSDPVTQSPDASLVDDPVEQADPVATDPLLSRYSRALCRLYVEPECVASQKTSCATHLEFGSMRECESFLAGTAADCTEDAEKVLTRVLPKLTACEEALAAHSCTDAAFCGPEGKVDAVGACAEVAASISAACPLDEDEFGE